MASDGGIGRRVDDTSNIHHDDDAPSGGDGKSWTAAYDDLQLALSVAGDIAIGGPIVRLDVAQGQYRPAPPNGDRMISFAHRARVSIHGGFAGVGSANPGDRDIRRYPSVLSGDLNQIDMGDAPNASWEDNSFLVVGSGTVLPGGLELDGHARVI